MNAATITRLRQQKDQFFKSHENSPLTEAQKAEFQGLAYFDYDPDLDILIEVHEFDEKSDMQLQTTTGDTRWYRRFAEFFFTIDDVEARLTIYQAPHGFFLPVVDAGAGEETYPAGRYLEPEQFEGTQFKIDFNQLYNPYCAYNDLWNCPITPSENRISVSIRAGEKLPEGNWADQQVVHDD